jgi:uncharacterized protein
MEITKKIAEELKIRTEQAEAAIRLIDEGNTIPFIARYRKEVTGALNDEVLRKLDERLTYLRGLEDRKQTVLSAIEEQGKLTADLKKRIEAAETLVVVEDLYRPYKKKRRTRAMMAKEKGLSPLAELIKTQDFSGDLEKEAAVYISSEEGKEVKSAEEALAGAKDILAEEISDVADYRIYIRDLTEKKGTISSKAKDPEVKSVYENYYDFEEKIEGLPGHRILALNRGEKEKILQVKVNLPEDEILSYLRKQVIVKENPVTGPVLEEVIEDALSRLIGPAIEREIRSSLTEQAEDGAIDVFGKNLHQLLMQPPIPNQTVLGWDPAFRTGCKLAVVDPTGKVLDTTVIFPTAPQNRVEESEKIVAHLIEKYHITLISLGNGTASRESEQIIVDLLKKIPQKVSYVIVNEAGASVYSASELATEEFPNFDVGQRSSTSMARRLQDPLAELVKIDPKAIGVGQYQHDMNQKKLSGQLNNVVEDCVNEVGVDLNTASYSLLEYVSGMTKTIAKNVVSYRDQNGRFTSRRDLLKVPKLGPKAFEQCAGFLRIPGGKNPLDNTSVHPESYEVAEKLLRSLGHSPEDLAKGGIPTIDREIPDMKKEAEDLGVGELTLEDIVKELKKPGRDPREDMPKPILRSDVLSIDDLKPGMVLKGTVRNIVDFGAFVDIGVHQDGLVHISHMTKKFIKHPLEVVSVGDVVDVEVLDVDPAKQRIALSMLIGEAGQDHSGKKDEDRKESGRSHGQKGSGSDRSRGRKNGGSERNDGQKRGEGRRSGNGEGRRNGKTGEGSGRTGAGQRQGNRDQGRRNTATTSLGDLLNGLKLNK